MANHYSALKRVRQIYCDDQKELLLQLREQLSGELLQQVYGVDAATEAGGWWRRYRLAASAEEQRLAAGTRMVLLESNSMEPAAVGVLGEIYVGGERVALGHERQTNAFVADGFSEQHNWYAKTHLAIDQGPIVVMIENYRTGLPWNLFTSCPEVKSGMTALGFNAPYL